MFDHKMLGTWILLLQGIAAVAPARADGHGAGFKLDPKAKVFTSPDRKVRPSSDDQRKENPLPWIEDWQCVYDTKTGAFSVPRGFAEHNAKAFSYPEPRSK